MKRRVTLEGHAFGERVGTGIMPVMPAKCATCPYGPNGDLPLRHESEMVALMRGSPICHSTGTLQGKPGTHICRGAREHQVLIFYRLGVIPEPTLEAWEATIDAMGLRDPPGCATSKTPVASDE